MTRAPGGTPRVFIKTFGCQMNVYDSSKMADVLHAAAGYEQTDDVESADLILFNTCSVREKAEEKVFSDLGRVKHLKARGALIGVGGCVASQEGEAIVARAPYVDLVFGPQTLHRLPAMIDARRRERTAQVDIAFPEIEKFDHLPPPRVDGPTAFVSIMEGCSKYCSYCVVPYTRGEEVSRPLADVLGEIEALVEGGVREVTLLGQNVNAWRETDAHGSTDFATLLERVAAIEAIARIRYTTSHPKEVTPALIDAHARIDKLARHLHLPVQHGSDRILAAMKRGYTSLEFKSTVRKLRAARPDLAISSDFIVGFPGETDDDFDRTLELVESVGFDHSFSFVYSPRPGTPAAALADATPAADKLARLQRLQQRLEAHGEAIGRSRVGSLQQVLVEGQSRQRADELSGRTSCNRVVNFAPGGARIGEMVNVRITDLRGHSLRGEVVATVGRTGFSV